MNLAVLSFFFSMDTKRAAANSLLVILLSQTASVLFTAARGNIPTFEWTTLAVMVSAGILGGLISAKLRQKMSVATTDRLFKGLLMVISRKYVSDFIPFSSEYASSVYLPGLMLL